VAEPVTASHDSGPQKPVVRSRHQGRQERPVSLRQRQEVQEMLRSSLSHLNLHFDKGLEPMNYDEALEYIHGTMKFGSKLGLHNIGVLLKLMGEPHKKLKYVHIAGTNGKGSTSAFISSILAEAGYRTGLFVSPFIQRFTERIRIGDEEISPAELAEITSFVKNAVDRMIALGESHPTEFEIITAIAFEYFYRKNAI
jgi:hypothetical protein